MLAMLVVILPVAAFSACGGSLTGQTRSFSCFGTTALVAVYDDFAGSGADERLEDCLAKIKAAAADIENSISAEVEGSSIAGFNAAGSGETVSIDKTAYEVLREAKRLYELTGGAYNPAAGLLVDLWGFSPRFNGGGSNIKKPYDRDDPESELPAQKYITAFKNLTNFNDVELSESDGKYYAKKPSNTESVDGVTYTMQLDLGGIGKGYAADVAAGILADAGYGHGYINLGQSSLRLLKDARGEKAPDWKISVASPAGAGNYAEIYAHDISVSTSGDYSRWYEIGGVRYSHIIDCSTGRPAAGSVCIATVLTASAAEGDALATALCVMGETDAARFIAEHDLKSLYALRSNGGYLVKTTLQSGAYKITDNSFNVN